MRWLRFRTPVKSLMRIVQGAALLILGVVAASWALGATLFPGPLAFTQDGTSLVGAVNGYPWPSIRDVMHLYGVVKVWNAHEGRVLARLSGQPTWIRSVSISPYGTTIAVAGDAPTIELWDLRSRSRRKVLEGDGGRIGRVTFSPDGATLAAAGWNGDVQLWDVSTSQTRLELRVSPFGATELAFSPDGTKLATGDGVAVRLWDTRSAQELRSIEGQNLHFLGFTGAGRNFLIARYRVRHNGAVTILDGATMAERLDLRLQLHSCGVRLAPDGRRIAVPERDGSVTVRDASSGAVLTRASGLSGTIKDLAFSPDGESLASCDDAGVICTWDARTGMRLARFPAASRMLMWVPAVLAAFTWAWARFRLRRVRADGLVAAESSPA